MTTTSVADSFTVWQSTSGATTYADTLTGAASTIIGWAPADYSAVGESSGWYGVNPTTGKLEYVTIVQSGYVTFAQVSTSVYIPTAAGGSVILDMTNGKYVYTAPAGYVGKDSFEYSLVSNNFSSVLKSVDLEVKYTEGANVRPVAVVDAYVITPNQKFDTSKTEADDGVLANDTDSVDNIDDALSAKAQTFLSVNGGIVSLYATGEFTYTPKVGYTGVDTFTYTAKDTGGATNQGTVNLYVGVEPPPPPTLPDTGPTDTGPADTGPTDTGPTDAGPTDAGPTDAGPTDAGPTDAGPTDAGPTDTGPTDTVTPDPVPEIVEPVNTAPTAAAAHFEGLHGTNITGTLAGLDAEGDAVEFSLRETAHGGLVTIFTDGTFVYTPAATFTGEDSFTYEVTDHNLSSTATVTLTVTNEGPTAVADSYTVAYGKSVARNVLTNDTDADGDVLATVAANITTAKGGTVVLDAEGNFTYTAATGYSGADSFEYVVKDGIDFANGTVSIKVDDPQTTLSGTSGKDTLTGSELDNMINGLAGDDILYGKGGNDSIYGGDGRDTLYGELGNDKLFGGAGKDLLLGGDGDDVLTGGANGDTFTGGAGRDQFVVSASTATDTDRITDFTRGTDKIVINKADFAALSTFDLLSDVLHVENLGTASTGEARLIHDSANRSLYFDDGLSGTADVLLTTFSRRVTITDDDIVVV